MPTSSLETLDAIPPVDVWSLLFERPSLEFPKDHGKFCEYDIASNVPESKLPVFISTNRWPLAIYVDVSTGREQTYSEIRDNSIRIGKALCHNWGWRKGDVMAVFTPNCADVGSAIFGVLWAGGIVCPVTFLCTVPELTSYLKSSGAKGIVTHATCFDVAKEAALATGIPMDHILLVGEPRATVMAQHTSSLQGGSTSVTRASINPKEDLAFLVYSSGTTGLPKGVMLSHENMVANIMQNTKMEEGITKWDSDRMIGFLPMFHIYGKLTPYIVFQLS